MQRCRFRRSPSKPNFRFMPSPSSAPVVHIEYPEWVRDVIDWDRTYRSDDEKMRIAIAVSRENVERGTGGPFGAAIFERDLGMLVAVGMNSLVRLYNCTLDAVMVAFVMSKQSLDS